MKGSVFSTIADYFREVYRGIRSVAGACLTVFPYLFSSGELRKKVTEQYPDPISARTADDLPPRTRGLLHNDIDRCTGCKECERVCPSRCIKVENELGPDSNKIWVSTFDIDFARCMFCGLCTEVCQPQSLVHTKQYEGAVYSLTDMVAKFGRGQVTPEQQEKWARARKSMESEDLRL